MPLSEETEIKSRKRRRRIIIGVAAVAAAIVVWEIVEAALRVDRYRPSAIARIEKATGLPAAIEKLDIDLLPWPALDVYGVRVGEGDFNAAAERITVRAKLLSLLGATPIITDVNLVNLALTAPADNDALSEKWTALAARLGEAGEGVAGRRPKLRQIRAGGARVYRGIGGEPYAEIDFEARDVLADVVSVAAEAKLALLGDATRIESEATINRKADAGTEILIDGEITAKRRAPKLQRALAGRFKASAQWGEGSLAVNGIEWDAPGLELAADLTRAPDGAIDCRIEGATLLRSGLAALLGLAPDAPVRLAPEKDAKAQLGQLHIAMAAEGSPEIVAGNGQFTGIAVLDRDGSSIAANIGGKLRAEDGAIFFEDVAGDGVRLNAALRPDLGAGTVAVKMNGRLEIDPDRIAPFVPLDHVTAASGVLIFEEIAGTFGDGPGVPSDFDLAASLSNGRIGVAAEGFEDTVTDVSGECHADASALKLAASGQSAQFGAIGCDGRYTFESRTWDGAVSGDLERVVHPFMTSPDARETWGPVFGFFGQSTLDVAATLASPDTPELAIQAARRGSPAFSAETTLARAHETAPFQVVRAAGALPLEALAPVLPAGVAAKGPAKAKLDNPLDTDAFSLDVDLAEVSIAVGQYLEKRVGDAASVAVSGSAAPFWDISTATVALLGEVVEARFEEDRLRIDDLELDLAGLVRLLPDGATAGGVVSGSIATQPTELALTFDRAALALTPELAIDSIIGRIQCQDGYWTISDLTITGANSDCTVKAGRNGRRWEGQLTGAKFDVNALNVMLDALGAFQQEPSQGQTAPKRDKTITGDFAVDLATLYWKRARLDDVHVDADLDEGEVRFQNIRFVPYTGNVSGTATLTKPPQRDQTRLALDLELEEIDARAIDELLFAESRGFKGVVTGKFQFDMPLGVDAPINDANGFIQFEAIDGSFGKLGLATKLLSVLRTFDVFRPKLPSFKDEGLTYEACAGNFAMTRGVLTVEEFSLFGPPTVISATGDVNFPGDAMNLDVRAGVREEAGRVTGKVPVLRNVVGEVKKRSAIRLHVSGSPYDPEVERASDGTLEGLREKLKDATDAIKETVTRDEQTPR